MKECVNCGRDFVPEPRTEQEKALCGSEQIFCSNECVNEWDEAEEKSE